MKTIGIVTCGGDCPGLNAVLYGVVRAAENQGAQVLGLVQGKLTEGTPPYHLKPLRAQDIDRFALQLGGTVLGSIVESDLARYDKTRWEQVQASFADARQYLDALIVVGGDGGIAIMTKICAQHHLPMIAIPKTIDNDVKGTTFAIGYQSAIEYVVADLDRIATTAMSHKRVMIVEVMGRDAGYIALASGIAAGADAILIPEIPYDPETLKAFLKKRYAESDKGVIVVVSEGVKAPKGEKVFLEQQEGRKRRYGGVSEAFNAFIEEDLPCRYTRLGHLQRGGKPSAQDRYMAILMGQEAINLIAQEQYNRMIGWQDNHLTHMPLEYNIKRKLEQTETWINIAHHLGIYMTSPFVSAHNAKEEPS